MFGLRRVDVAFAAGVHAGRDDTAAAGPRDEGLSRPKAN